MTYRGQRSRSNPKNFEVEYLENGTRWRDGVHRSQIERHIHIIQAFEWHEKLSPQMTFSGQRSRSNPENFEVEYLENGTR